jgi:hypothetical protein
MSKPKTLTRGKGKPAPSPYTMTVGTMTLDNPPVMPEVVVPKGDGWTLVSFSAQRPYVYWMWRRFPRITPDELAAFGRLGVATP